MTSLNKIADKLMDLADKQPKVFKEFYQAELEYQLEFDKMMMEAHGQYPSQPLREAHVRQEIMKLPLFEKYYAKKYEYDTLTYQTRVLQTIARLLQSESFRENSGIGGV